MLIFDHFESFAAAASFAAAVAELEEDRELIVTTRRLDSFKTFDPSKPPLHSAPIVDAVAIEYLFPFELSGVMVYVGRLDRYDDATSEEELEQLAVRAGGRFAGT